VLDVSRYGRADGTALLTLTDRRAASGVIAAQ
jgi:hypothetical protein